MNGCESVVVRKIRRGSGVNKQRHHSPPHLVHCLVKRGITPLALRASACTGVEQSFHYGGAGTCDGTLQRNDAVLVRSVDVGPVGDQRGHGLRVTSPNGLHQFFLKLPSWFARYGSEDQPCRNTWTDEPGTAPCQSGERGRHSHRFSLAGRGGFPGRRRSLSHSTDDFPYGKCFARMKSRREGGSGGGPGKSRKAAGAAKAPDSPLGTRHLSPWTSRRPWRSPRRVPLHDVCGEPRA